MTDRPGAAYTFFFHDGEAEGEPIAGATPSFEIVDCGSDDDARALALELLKRHPARRAVEIWVMNRRVGWVSDDPGSRI